MRRVLPALLVALAWSPCRASVYTPQSAFNLPLASMNAMDSDAVGNLYVLGLPPGTATYTVASYATQGITPVFSFNTGLSSPTAFAVESSGIVDIIDGSGGIGAITLNRFQNNGTFVGKTTYSAASPYYNVQGISAAIDKVNGRVYIATQYWVNIYCVLSLGVSCPPSGTEGFINQYDFAGNLLKTVAMPGRSSIGGCYTPSQMTVDPQGNVYVADNVCQQVLKYSSTETLLSQTAASKWTYNFSARGMWTDAASNLYISEPVCGPSGCPNGVVKLGPDQSFQTSFVADSPTGCAWDQRILYLTSSGGQPLDRFVFNGPPTAPAQIGPLGTVVQHSSSAYMSWQSSSDPDGDPITYTVLLNNSPTQLPPIGSTSQTNFTTQPLTFGTTYYWQVLAQATYLGLPLQTTPSPVIPFNLNLVNSPPGWFGVLAGTGTVVTRATSVTLAWQASIDPDGDPVVYDVFWQTPSQSAMSQVGTTSQTSWQMTGLSFGATYYWSVRARDVYNASTWLAGGAPQPYHLVFQDTPPPVPTILGGTGTLAQHTFTPQTTLVWSNVLDADGDPVAYRLYVGTSPAAMALVQDGTATSYNLASAQLGTTYYWEVSAYDPYAASTTSVQSLLFVLQDSPPSPVVYLTTGTTYAQHTTSPTVTLSWAPSTDADGDPVSYRLDAQTSTGAWPSFPMGSATSLTLNTQLETTYYWRVTAYDAFAASTGTWMSFIVHLANRPPYPIVYSSPVTITTRATSFALNWQDTGDPDGDPVSYAIYLSSNPSTQYLVQQGTATAYTLNFQFGTTYYWRVTATDIFGAQTSGPVQSFMPIFQDTPPPAPSILSGAGTLPEHTLTPTATLSWSSVVDADGDPVTYRLYVGTTPAALSLVQDGQGVSYNLPSPLFGTTYYWQVSAYDPYAATLTPVQSLLIVLQDSPPSPVVYLTTATAFAEHTASPTVTLSWQPSTDPDWDPVSYRLDVQTSTGAWPSVAMGNSTSITLDTLFATTYYWRVTAYDAYAASTGTWMSFVVHLANRPPYPIVYTSPATLVTRATSTSLTWQDTGDPDGDPVAYALYLSTSPAAQSLAQQGGATAYTLNFQFGTTYYWYVAATDSFGARTIGALQTFLPVFQDTPPPAPQILSGSGTVGEHTLTPWAALSWSSVVDADGDPVAYRLAVGTNPAALAVVQDGPGLSYNLASPLFGTTYYWQITAHDPYAATSSPIQSLYLYLQNSPPLPFSVQSGTGTITTRATSQLLSWQNAVDPDGDLVTYDLALSTTPGALPVVQSSATTSYMLATQFGTTYYWQVTARDGFGGATSSGLQTLLPLFWNPPPTVPLNQSKTGTILYHGFSPSQSFFWQASTDPDGDPFTYSLRYGTDPAHMAVISPATLGLSLLVPLNTAFYYSIVATDIYGASSPSPINWVYYQFVNNPPGAFDVIGTSGTIVTRQTSEPLSWTASVDPDGDPVTYGVFAGTSPAALAPLTTTNKTWALLPNMAFGTTYYWRVDAYDGFGGTTTATEGVQSVVNLFYDPPPSAIVYLSTAGAYSEHTASPSVALSWLPSTNAAGDPISYRLDIQTSTGAWPSLQLGAGTSFDLATVFETTYTWRVTAMDPYGGASTGAWQSFIVHLYNLPPYPIAYTSPATITTRATSYALSWQNTGDPDGDPVTYALYLSTNPAAQYLVQQGTSTGYALNFQYGTTYYWYVSATDSFGAQTVGSVKTFLSVFQDTPPPAPSILSGSGTVGEHTLTPSATLAWSSVVDADGDPVSYRLAVGTNPAALSVVQNGQSLSYNLPSPLFGTTYYWQVTAYDPYAATSAPVQSLYLYLQDSPPQPFAILTGTGAIQTRASSQLLSWQAAVDPDGDAVTYDLAVSTLAGAPPVVQSSTATSYTLATQFGTTYYWQVTARDGFGGATSSGLQTLSVAFWNPPPTVPVNQSKTGTIPYHGFSPSQSFFWQASTDPDGDPFAYSLRYGTDSAHMATINPASLGVALPVPLNTAFYYSIVATDIYGAASPSPTEWVYYQFVNNPPGPFDVVSASGTFVTRATTAGLAWTVSTDPDGDQVNYRVYGGTSTSSMSALGDTVQPNFTLSNLAFGTTYYWRADAYDGYGGTTTVNGGTQSLLYLFKDSPPAAPVYLTTTTVFNLHTTSPAVTLAWAPSADADGDPVTYVLDVQTSTGAWPSMALGGTTSLAFSPLFDTTYYWRVTAVDSYASTPGPWQSLIVHFLNPAPGMPTILSGTGVAAEHTLTPSAALSWSATTDPDGDPATYVLSLGTAPAALATVLSGSSTSYALPSPLFGTTYYWQVSAQDSYGAASTTPLQTLLLTLQNNPPLPFSVVSGSGTFSTRATSTTLSWQNAGDPDGDAVTYGVFLATASAPLPLVQLSTATILVLSFQYGTTYYWRVDAYDGFGGTTTISGGVQSLLPLFLNDPPAQVNLVAPFKGSPVVTTMRDSVSISWQPVTTPQGDPVSYAVYLGQSPSSLGVVTQISQTQAAGALRLAAVPAAVRPQSQVRQDGNSITLTLTNLDYYKTYYLRVVATNPYGASSQTPLQSFSLGAANGFPKAYNYPNPFNPLRGVTHIVFNAPPSGYAKATVSIYSELQDLLFQREYDSIPPGVSQVDFDGRDRYGRSFFNGSYICRVRFEGPDDKETFYIMVVK